MNIISNALQNTTISFVLSCNHDFTQSKIPSPTRYRVATDGSHILTYVLDGTFTTRASVNYLQDTISRFCVTYAALYVDFEPLTLAITDNKRVYALEVISKELESLKTRFSLEFAKRFEDERFWQMKLWVEAKLKAGETVTLSGLESFGLTLSAERSTIRSKARSIYRWYANRDFTISTRVHEMSRSENAKKVSAERAKRAKAAVLSAATSLKFLGEKVSSVTVAEACACSRTTASKYLKELKAEELI